MGDGQSVQYLYSLVLATGNMRSGCIYSIHLSFSETSLTNYSVEVGVEDRPKIVHGDAFLIDDQLCDRPVDGQPFDDDEIGHHRSH